MQQLRRPRAFGLVLAIAFALAAVATTACGDDETAGSAVPALEDDAAGTTTDATGPGSDAMTKASSPIFEKRPYGVTQPSKYDPNVPTPLVVSLHGYTAVASTQDSYFKLSALAEKKTFLLALPEGTKDGLGNQFWNASDACCDFYQSGVDDVAYLRAVIDDMKARFNVDAKRVYIVGHSNGGFMAHRLACELSTEIAGIVSLAGAVFNDPARCNPTSPVAVLQVHGDHDETVSYTGGSLIQGLPPYPSAATTVATWAAKNGCEATLTTTDEKLDLSSSLAGDETTVARHACTKGAAEFWTIVGGEHIPAFQPTWAERFYAFLEAHPKP